MTPGTGVGGPTPPFSRHTLAVDSWGPIVQNRRMSASLIVLNGPSSSGKSSIISALQDLWPRPQFASGLDVFIGGWPDSHVTFPGDDGSPASESGMRIVQGDGPAPSWIPEYDHEFHTVTRLAHRFWADMRIVPNSERLIVNSTPCPETFIEFCHFSRCPQFDQSRRATVLSDSDLQEGAAVFRVSPHPLQELPVNSLRTSLCLDRTSVIYERPPENA